MTHKLTKTDLHYFTEELLQEGKTISVDWDGGGDQCICNVLIDGSPDYQDDGEEFSWQLANYIAEHLQLPDVGEYFGKGEGTLQLNDKEEITITFSGSEYFYEYEDELSTLPAEQVIPPETATLAIEDTFNLSQYANRINFEFWGNLSWKHMPYAYGNWTVQQGDDLQEMNRDKLLPYTQQIERFLKQERKNMLIKDVFKRNEKGRQLSSLRYHGLLNTDSEIIFTISKSYCVFTEFTNTTKTLFNS